MYSEQKLQTHACQLVMWHHCHVLLFVWNAFQQHQKRWLRLWIVSCLWVQKLMGTLYKTVNNRDLIKKNQPWLYVYSKDLNICSEFGNQIWKAATEVGRSFPNARVDVGTTKRRWAKQLCKQPGAKQTNRSERPIAWGSSIQGLTLNEQTLRVIPERDRQLIAVFPSNYQANLR